MLNKACSLARAVAILLAIVAGFVAINGVDVGLVLVVLGLIVGLTTPSDRLKGLAIGVLVLPAVGLAVGRIPAVGVQLGAVAGNLALVFAGVVATGAALYMFNAVKSDVLGLAGKA